MKPREPSPIDRAALTADYLRVRAASEAICAPLETEDYQVQSILETSPPKWHLAHVSWFFETFVLKPYAPGYRPFHPLFERIFNSYYESVGPFHPRADRHVLARPTVAEVYRYRHAVDAAMRELLATCPESDWSTAAARTTLGLHHEAQHQELLHMDIKANFAACPLQPAYRERPEPERSGAAPALRWIERPGGVVEMGYSGDGFAFDNEMPRHRMLLEAHRLASRLVTNGEYLEFIEAGGYRDPRWWLSDGWAAIKSRGWSAPLYWAQGDRGWSEMTLAGPHALDPALPVAHVSFYEADAYARFRGVRLPREAELETVLDTLPVAGNFAETGRLHPDRARDDTDGQWYGDLWEWTQSPYTPYPGFRPAPGALGEYNGKFMANQFVLRGGACVTPRWHMRPSYRNFFYPHDRWPFTGVRLAGDAA